ncbi:hypothetical protein [Aquimarina rubra]|uniref:Uncharacterized protein n=1 Tax=Aquimarina rubra TaxID=1920033 RepID=A0ABW5LJK2_9FLAO
MRLWKLTCVRSSGKALKGMTVEIVTERPEPSSDEISQAVNRKYGIRSTGFNISSSNWTMEIV